jgi:hypothetical protein
METQSARFYFIRVCAPIKKSEEVNVTSTHIETKYKTRMMCIIMPYGLTSVPDETYSEQKSLVTTIKRSTAKAGYVTQHISTYLPIKKKRERLIL